MLPVLPHVLGGSLDGVRHVVDVLLRHHHVLRPVDHEGRRRDVPEAAAADVAAAGVDVTVGLDPGGPQGGELGPVDVLHGLPHARGPLGHVGHPGDHVDVGLAHVGVGSPHHQLLDSVGARGGEDERGDAAVRPAQQGVPGLAQLRHHLARQPRVLVEKVLEVSLRRARVSVARRIPADDGELVSIESLELGPEIRLGGAESAGHQQHGGGAAAFLDNMNGFVLDLQNLTDKLTTGPCGQSSNEATLHIAPQDTTNTA